MKNRFLLLIVWFGFFAQSQTHRFIYDVEYRKDSTSAITTKENYHLDIAENEVLYYTRDFFLADSLVSNNIPFPKNLKLNVSTIISHKTGSNEYNEYDLLENTVLNLTTTKSQQWKLTSEKKQVKNLILQKATTNWGGRNWTAWFTSEIPFPEGPYKFHGLPGLIVELFDDKNNYHFELAKSEKINDDAENQFIVESRKMAVSVSWEKYKAAKLKFYQSPVNFIRNGIGDSGNEEFFLNDGTIVNSKNSREINDRLRNNIKKYNNPIEINKAINYSN